MEVIPTQKHPLVYADWLHAPGKPTVCATGIRRAAAGSAGLWETPPFEPSERNGNLYARGSADDKGQMYSHIKAIEALRAVHGKPPVNVKFLIEGEEEVGGESIAKYVAENPEKLKADVALVSDTEMYARRPADAIHRAARLDLTGNRSHGAGAGSAFGAVRRRGAECGVRADRTAGEGEGRGRTNSDSRHVRRREPAVSRERKAGSAAVR